MGEGIGGGGQRGRWEEGTRDGGNSNLNIHATGNSDIVSMAVAGNNSTKQDQTVSDDPNVHGQQVTIRNTR